MPEWKLYSQYEYRFGSIVVQASMDGQQSPVYQIPIREVIKKIPRHEIMECIRMADDPTIPPDDDIDKWRRLAIREADCTGKVVLDVGGYDGWAAKLALECGAARAICLDNHQYEHYGWEGKKLEGVEYVAGDLMDFYHDGLAETLLHKRVGGIAVGPLLDQPDVLINYNVLYHTKNPWAFLDKCRDIIKEDGLMLLCTLFRYHDGPWAYLYEPRECNPTDDTVYWGFSLSALERLLKHTGWDFEQVGLSYDRVVYRCSPIANWERSHQDT